MFVLKHAWTNIYSEQKLSEIAIICSSHLLDYIKLLVLRHYSTLDQSGIKRGRYRHGNI